MAKPVTFCLTKRDKKYNGKEWCELVGSFEVNNDTVFVTIGCDSSGHPTVYTGEKGKAAGKNFVYARGSAIKTAKLNEAKGKNGKRKITT